MSPSTFKTSFLFLCLTALTFIRSETTVDDCNNVHGRQRKLGSLRVSSANLVVDSTQGDTFDGDIGRFKRPNADPGYLSYLSDRGFESMIVTGYVFRSLPSESWSLKVTKGEAVDTDVVLDLNAGNLGRYSQRQTGGWSRFRIRLGLNVSCPDRMNIVLEGTASNNEFAGWGLQLSRIVLVQSWFQSCNASCQFESGSCPSSSYRQSVDPANDFRDVYSRSKNIRIDDTSARQHHGGDTGRFTRSNNLKGELHYVSSGFRSIDVEVYQYRPYNTRLSLIPYASDACRPIVLPASYQTVQTAQGWRRKIARFDLRDLPMCPTNVVLRIEGGDVGWELQIARLTFTLTGRLERDTSTKFRSGSDDDDDSDGIDWWVYMVIIVAVIVVLLVAACLVRRCAHCCGSGEGERRLPIWNSRAWRRGQRAYDTGIPGTPTAQNPAVISMQQGNSFSFPVQQEASPER